LARIYTRTGDNGTTGLIGGKRVSKDSPFIEAFGALDEVNALIGVLRSNTLPERVDRVLAIVQNDLFTLGAQLATPEGVAPKAKQITDESIVRLENQIDAYQEEIKPLKAFILPGGTRAAAELHLARTVIRRAERLCVTLSKTENVDPRALKYLNRLSDLCFVLARYLNQLHSVPEIHPDYGN